MKHHLRRHLRHHLSQLGQMAGAIGTIAFLGSVHRSWEEGIGTALFAVLSVVVAYGAWIWLVALVRSFKE